MNCAQGYPIAHVMPISGKSEIGAPKPAHAGCTAPGVVIAAIASVDDVSILASEIRGALARFQTAGIRETRVFKAFDDGQEVLILQEIDDEDSARRWIEHPDVVARWMSGAGVGAYPPLFVGKLVGMMRIDG